MPRRSTWNVLLTGEKATGYPRQFLARFLKSAQAARFGAASDRGAHQVAPLRPGAVIVANLRVAEQVVQYEPGVRRPLADPAVRDDVVRRLQAQLVPVDLDQ